MSTTSASRLKGSLMTVAGTYKVLRCFISLPTRLASHHPIAKYASTAITTPITTPHHHLYDSPFQQS